ncbi:MAG: VanW family protein [Negativicutes bacterium]|nr:VanW family protein [Negativicutes bacterium]
MQPITTKRATNLIFFLGVIVLFSLISMVSINASFSVTDEIYNGVRVGNIDVGGLTIPGAENKIAAVFRERTQQQPITLTYKNEVWTIAAEDIDLEIDAAELARQAYAVGRSGNSFNQLQEKYLAINRGHQIPLTPSYNSQKLQALVVNIASKIDKTPQNASIAYVKSNVTVEPEASGYKVDTAKTIADFTAKLETNITFSIPLTVNEIIPNIQARDLEGIDGIVSSYSTQFDPSDQNRSQNVALASKNVNGVLVKRGEVFSFNTYVGPRLAQYGYKIAPVFINGKLLPDWGGGVCQVSSTLYNAALLADLTIEERTSHYRPPGYVPLGQDATVADNQLDFRFKNSSSHNIYVSSEIIGNQLTVLIFGKLSANPQEIQVVAADKKVMEPNTIVKQDPQLELGKEIVEVEGQKGFQVTTYRVKYMAGKEVNRELLASDDFPPEDRQVRVGTKLPARQTSK